MSLPTLADLIAERPGSSLESVHAYYGRFAYREHPTQRGAITIDPAWSNANLVTLTEADLPGWPFKVPYNRNGMPVHKKVARQIILTWAVLRKYGLHTLLTHWDGTWTARHQLWNPAAPLSYHSWAMAIDMMAHILRYGLPIQQMPARLRDFLEVWEECGWTAGMRWTPADGMHVQWTDPVPGTPRGLTPLIRPSVSPELRPADPPDLPVPDIEKITARRLIVDGDYVGRIAKASVVGDKLYVNTEGD